MNPANGGTVIVGTDNLATVSWAAVSGAEYYIVDLYPAGSSCAASPTYCGQTTASTSFSFTPQADINNYTYSVAAVNTSCGSSIAGSWSTPATFTLMANITGTFYDDPGQAAQVFGGVCTLGGSPTAGSPGTGASITAQGLGGGSYTTPGISGSTFTLTVPYWPTSASGNNVLTLTPGVDGSGINYACTCPEGCTYSGIGSPQTAVNFFVLPENLLAANWWQVQGGNAYAGRTTGISVYSPAPDPSTCNGTCSPYVASLDADDTALSAGVVVTGGGAIDSQRETGNQQTYVSEQSPQLLVTGATATRFQEKYEYFYRKFTFQNLASPNTAPAGLPNGQAYLYTGDLTIDSTNGVWNVPAGQEVIVFVNGNLTFSDPTNANQLVTVADGGFLAFIVSGNITVNENVGNETLASTTPNLEGIYIADGSVTIASRGSAAGGDDRFVGAGSFIGWSGVNVNRDFSSDADNSRLLNAQTTPTELFIFRPDLVSNIPEAMTSPRYIWQETN